VPAEKPKADTAGNLTAIPARQAAARQDIYLSQKQLPEHSQMVWASGGGRGRQQSAALISMG